MEADLADLRMRVFEHMASLDGEFDPLTLVDAISTVPDEVLQMWGDEFVGGFLIIYIGQYAHFSKIGGYERGWTVQ